MPHRSEEFWNAIAARALAIFDRLKANGTDLSKVTDRDVTLHINRKTDKGSVEIKGLKTEEMGYGEAEALWNALCRTLVTRDHYCDSEELGPILTKFDKAHIDVSIVLHFLDLDVEKGLIAFSEEDDVVLPSKRTVH